MPGYQFRTETGIHLATGHRHPWAQGQPLQCLFSRARYGRFYAVRCWYIRIHLVIRWVRNLPSNWCLSAITSVRLLSEATGALIRFDEMKVENNKRRQGRRCIIVREDPRLWQKLLQTTHVNKNAIHVSSIFGQRPPDLPVAWKALTLTDLLSDSLACWYSWELSNFPRRVEDIQRNSHHW